MRPFVDGKAAWDAAAAAMDGPFVWGKRDCLMAVSDALVALGMSDFAGPIRGTYGTKRGALRVIAGAGGLLQLGARLARETGFRSLDGPAWPGDVGVAEVQTDDGPLPAFCLCIGSAWAVKSLQGARFVSGAAGVWRAE